MQLRRDNAAGNIYNLVGFQTHLRFPEQKRVFSMIPALHDAEFVRYGVMHRNTFLNSPKLLDACYADRRDPMVAFAGQMTGVEGYVESCASGYLAAVSMAARLAGETRAGLRHRDGHRRAGALCQRQHRGIVPADECEFRHHRPARAAGAWKKQTRIWPLPTGRLRTWRPWRNEGTGMKIILMQWEATTPGCRGARCTEAAKEFGVQIVLVGRGADILASMKAQGWDTLPDGVELANAEDVVDMHCDPAAVVKQHPNSSLVLGARMLAQGGGDAFISVSNTGALLTAATLLVKRIRGIRRAAFSPVLPTKDGHAILIDAGANAECTPEFLLQFGCMGSFYAQKALGIESPRVGLLNNGAEDTKGDPLHREAHQLLKRAAEQGTIHFVGNVEARDVPFGAADVIVADGFSGNVLLKTMEGTAMFMSDMMKQMFYRNPLTMLGALLCKRA